MPPGRAGGGNRAHEKADSKNRILGALRGQIKIIDPDWWKPMTDEEVQDFLSGRY